MKLIVMPSKKLWYTGIALAGTCVVGAIIVGALHIYEKVKKRLFCSVVWTERRLIFHELILRSIEKDSQVSIVSEPIPFTAVSRQRLNIIMSVYDSRWLNSQRLQPTRLVCSSYDNCTYCCKTRSFFPNDQQSFHLPRGMARLSWLGWLVKYSFPFQY